MMRYLKSKIISVLALGLVTPALFPASVFAETHGDDYVEEKRLELELREREYLGALEKKK